jgi:hypothetical protein
LSLGLALAKALNMLEESRFSVGGLGVDSLLDVEGALVFTAVEVVVFLDAWPFAKKSFAVEGWEILGSCLVVGLVSSAGLGFVVWDFERIVAAAGGGGGCLAVRRFTLGLRIVPYFG